MNDNERLDLSALDPMNDPGHWGAVVESTLARVDVSLRERAVSADPLSLIASWRRPLLIAAAIVLALLIPAEIALESREARLEQVYRLVELSTGWIGLEQQPTGADFLRALGDGGQQ